MLLNMLDVLAKRNFTILIGWFYWMEEKNGVQERLSVQRRPIFV